MEQIGKLMENLSVEKAPAPTNSLTVSGKSTTNDPDSKMLELKYASPQIYLMPEVQLYKECRTLLLKIHVITGWAIPSKEMMAILSDQFCKKLIESYGHLNTEEIEYAFRQYGTVIEDWGKEMNLNLLDKVLIPYLNQRLYISADEERKKEKPAEQKILTDQQLEDIQRLDIENVYQQMRSGRVPYGLPVYFKELLIKDGLLKPGEDISSFFVQRLGNGIENIYIPK